MALSFIIIDDSELDCFIARKIIAHADKNICINPFQNAQHALEFIASNPDDNNGEMTIVLLDLQMPLMNGFEFVDEFEKLPAKVKKTHTIVILSSTRNTNDIYKIQSHKSVHSLMEKPLTMEKLFSLMLQLKTHARSGR